MHTYKVLKFGGASIQNADAMRNVATIIQQNNRRKLLVVASAIQGITNSLEQVVEFFFEDKTKSLDALQDLKADHIQITSQLIYNDTHSVYVSLDQLFDIVSNFIQTSTSQNYDLVYDQIVCLGELASTLILTALLNAQEQRYKLVDARNCIRTDTTYREGRIDWTTTESKIEQLVKPILDDGKIVITQGFIGHTASHFTTTLGREGSDYSAAIFSYCLGAGDMTIWKDVPGILTGDPKLFHNVQKIDNLSYREAIEMTYYGAKVIHPKTIKPLQNKGIPLWVKDFQNPSASGTIISVDVEDSYPPIVVIEKDQVMLHISTKDFSFVAEQHLAHLFEIFAEYRFKVNLMRNTAISFSVCLTNKPRTIEELMKKIAENYRIRSEFDLEIITIRHYNDQILEELKQNKIILLEERIPKTVQIVTKESPMMQRKS